MKLAAKTNIGHREENQDNYRAARLDDGSAWALVCDGMGGPKGGKLAAQLAVETLQKRFLQGLGTLPAGDEMTFLLASLRQANVQVYHAAQKGGENHNMGTTAVCALVRRGTAHLAHVGDSRAYLCRAGRAQQLTRDHSVVQEMLESGSITPQEALNHPDKHLITRALGVESVAEPEYASCAVQPGDVILLCSDGLSNVVSEEEMGSIAASVPFFELPDALVEKALASDGRDNITVVVMGIEPEEEAL